MTHPDIANYLGLSRYPVRYKIRLIRKMRPGRVIGWKTHHSLLMKRAWLNGSFDHMQGATHPNWRGDNASSCALHVWARRLKPKPDFCEICGEKPPYDLANVSGNYKRDITDFQWLCRKCHMQSDGRLDRLYSSLLKRHTKTQEIEQVVI